MVQQLNLTSQVYGDIRDGEYVSAIHVLESQVQRFPRSRAALSLLGYCYYHLQDYELAADSYAKLVRLYPLIGEYRVYHCQSLLKAGDVEEARRVEAQIDSNQRTQHELMLEVSIKFEDGDLNGCKTVLSQCVEEDPETILAHATLCAKEAKYDEALELYSEAFNIQGFEAEIAYNIALCNYMMGDYEDALEVIQEIIDRGIESNPEFTPSSSQDHDEKIDVNNSMNLQESFLIESYNLKAAVEYDMGNITKARKTLKEMPQRIEEELDPVTLHNQGLINIDLDITGGFEKLKFLLGNPPFPPETFGNLLLLYCKHGYHDLSADILAENSHLTYEFLSEDLYEYLDASIMASVSPDEASIKCDTLTRKYANELRKLSKEMESINEKSRDDSFAKLSKVSFDKMMSFYTPLLMTQAYIHWEREEYMMVEQLFRKHSDLCVDVDVWKLNVAHTFFVQQGSKFKDAIKYYDTFVKEKTSANILNVTPIVLANLCVSYIMTNRNEEAEDIMKLIEKQEGSDSAMNNDKEQKHHSCIINLVIGTLYCEKGNFEFGISRICKSLEPIESKLGADTWFYTKRCLLALADQLAKQMLLLQQESFSEIILFLDDIDRHGSGMTPFYGDEVQTEQGISKSSKKGGETISSEARQLKNMFMKLME